MVDEPTVLVFSLPGRQAPMPATVRRGVAVITSSSARVRRSLRQGRPRILSALPQGGIC
jgi:hypothetical protein